MKHITDYLEREQVEQVLDAARVCNHRDYLMIRVLWRTGCRVSELLNITPSDIETRNRVINITKGKGGKQRRVPLDPETIAMLSEYVFAHDIQENQPIFGIKRCQVHTIVKKYGKQVGVDIHPHTFRHSFAIHLVRNESDLRRLQLLLGHSNINTTQVYLQFNDEDLRELYDRIPF